LTSIKNTKHLVVLTGPTAVGKTVLAIQLARYFNTEIISADSRQIYKELHIGTASPSEDDLKTVKHHFIKSISAMDYYNAGMFELEVIQRLGELFKIHDIIIMAGGSTLYIDAVCNGMDEFPPVDMSLRKSINEQYKINGIEYLQKQLELLDPVHYQRIDIKNPNRMMKAIEICMITGKSYSSLLTYTQKKRDFNIIRTGINMEREFLYDKINSRVDKMISDGLVNEVKSLDYARETNALRTVGYREIFEYLDGKLTLDEAINKIKINTRHYAKRQITWFSRNNEIKWFNPQDFVSIIEYIQRISEHSL
jgi:tRNA dimethylallyltransferase